MDTGVFTDRSAGVYVVRVAPHPPSHAERALRLEEMAYATDETKVIDSGASALCLAMARLLAGESPLGQKTGFERPHICE